MSNPRNPRRATFNPEEFKSEPMFLLGNGKTRERINLDKLSSLGTVVGCNALYRDFTPDILVAIDAKMLKELKDAEFGTREKEFLICPANRNYGVVNSYKYRTNNFNTSGCFAMQMIADLFKPKECYMFGMDGFPGNVYDKTLNYAANTLQNFTGVLSYYMRVLTGEGNTVFINVNEKDAWPKAAHETDKYKYITFEEFEEKFGDVAQLAEAHDLGS